MLDSLPDIPRVFRSPWSIVAATIKALYPPVGLSVHEAARRHRVLSNPGGGYSGPWKDELAPYLVRPMKCLSDDRYKLVAVMGPGQSGKSEIGNNWALYTAIEDPANLIWLGPDKNLLRSYVVEKINPMIRLSPEMRSRQLRSPSADNIYSKEFQGCVFNFVWPVGSQMRMRTAPRYVADDFDGIEQDIGGEGDPLTLLGTRGTTYEGREKGLALSSPALGAQAGIEALVRGGTDERFVCRCPTCGEVFAPDYDLHFRFNHSGTAEEAAATASVICPNNGCVLTQPDKAALLASALTLGRDGWIGRDQTIAPDGTVSGPAPEGSVASFRIDGLVAFTSWPKLAEEHRRAEMDFERGQNEGKLRAFFNTRVGKNYRSQVDNFDPVTVEDLEGRTETALQMKQVPAWVRFLTAAVDVQFGRFEVMVQGWGQDGESVLIDRFALRQLGDGRTDIAPERELAHWDVIRDQVMKAAYPLAADPGYELPIANTAIDSGGLAGVSENATEFVRRLIHSQGFPDWGVTLVKGANQMQAPAFGRPSFDVDDRGKRRADAVALHVIGVHVIKDTIEMRLRLTKPGPGYIHIPGGFKSQHLEELRAEEKRKGVWVKLGRNETWDLAVYNEAARLRLREHRGAIDWSNPPSWARRRPRSAAPVAPAPAVANAVRKPASSGRRVLSRGIV